ncbi:hypothetical protein GUITHDRAFT_143664 [Guillardia theta CCMP2712]|uniref:Uncharacterized protein n=1 Tax=Guillardia theta (strain CCMP2712) TaxID=905079 RepID=L1ITU6_GUITC|nr:hypothetical protein GUITHDRAFT_143664 [Guillardia theta CCMP2712]EKX39260.1 hypothetical protein GUITHDRAFT_143664 [Guillardia theta CCMP2712]|eukprot:XP_005826240.1 hypothetical protein GUITHDRAFT_143664 [Guillardia theta CCMP2712]
MMQGASIVRTPLSLPLLLLLSLLLLAGPVAADDHTYKQCNVQADCDDKDYPICMPLWNDEGMATLDTKVVDNIYIGVCVQCRTDCDCDTDEYCANDFTLNKFSSALNALDRYTEQQRALVGAHYSQYQSLKIRSVCKKRDLPDEYDFCNTRQDIVSDTVSKSYDSGHLYSTGYIHVKNKNRFCGRIEENAFLVTDEIQCVGTGCGGNLLVGKLINTPAICIPTVYVSGTKVINGTCQAEQMSITGGGFNFKTSVVDWEGYCKDNSCKDCRHGDTMCTEVYQQARVCINGKWKLRYSATMIGYERSYDMVSENIQLQTQITIALFTSLCFVVAVVCAVLLTVRRPAASSISLNVPRPEDEGYFHNTVRAVELGAEGVGGAGQA